MSDDAAGRPDRRWRGPAATFGEAAAAALLIAVVSGVAIAVPYDPADPLTSVAVMLLANPAAAFLRNLHYWTAQAFVVLSVLHAWDHLRRPDVRRLRLGPWLRVCLSVPAIGLLAWSGFVLKGDVEAQQALRVVSTALADVPGVGAFLAGVLFGGGGRLSLVYVHHVATFTMFVWFVLVEHGRILWPRPVAAMLVLVPAAAVSLWLSPSLHDGLSAVVKGPWYFVGLQEAFHWSSRPGAVLAAAAAPLVALLAMRWMSTVQRRAAVRILVGATVFYAGLTVVGWGFRGPNWTWTDAWRSAPRSLVAGFVLATPDPSGEPLRGRALPVVMGRPEGCLVCHGGVTGLSPSHAPSTIGCAACHLGNVFSLVAAVAHAGMIAVPGNLADASRTCGGECHAAVVTRVERSLMTSLAGIVAVDRRAFGEAAPGVGAPPHIAQVGFTPADRHLRHLCASCHLGASKLEPSPVTESSRGGGCTACHVSYAPAAVEALRQYRAARGGGGIAQPPVVHPNVALVADDTPCFGCHSRSGRISLSYGGWHEADPLPPEGGGRERRTLEDGRVVVRATADTHAAKGMLCIDCHTAREVMGDGVRHARQLDQSHVACEDCHPSGASATIALSGADEETRRIAALRALPIGDRPRLVTASGDVLVNAFRDADGALRLVRKKDGGRLELRAPRPECRDAVHGRVSCIGCHTAWAPRCPTCHTSFDPGAAGYDTLDGREVPGDWTESGGRVTAMPPTLGVRRAAGTRSSGQFEPYIPGMIATLDGRRAPSGSPQPIFRRWYARAFSHTVTRTGRSCASCHTDPVALGYGEGRLDFVEAGPQQGRWRFTAALRTTWDGLPEDAWVGFLQTRDRDVSTRDDVRPLSVDEQRRVLAVGACLNCHAPESAVMRASLRGFDAVRARMTARCRQAVW